ncbi:MAG: hypothetical protein CL843_15150 [Crocinitomicaceae bacterium]|nr:hypothetical protein [Crocinitomicaceae bacterium]|tara:strand:+ start:4522 stop:6435 length:1914 start_codon:yes stop_codon:yes gene_type:complete
MNNVNKTIDQVKELFEQKNYEAIFSLLTDEFLKQKNNLYLYAWRARTYNQLKEFEKAILDLSKAIEIDPNNALAYHNRGNVYYHLKEFEKAIQDYNKAIEIDPNDASAYYNRGVSYSDLKEFEKAIQDYSKAMEINPNDASVYYNRGNAYYHLNEFEKAIQDYSKAMEIDPNDVRAYHNRGNVYSLLKEFEKAIQDLNKAMEIDPNDARAYNNRGVVHSDLKEFEKAIQDYNKAIEINPNDAPAYNNRGNAHSDLKEFEKAIQDYSKAMEIDPDQFNFLDYHINLLKEKLEDQKEIEKTHNLNNDGSDTNSLLSKIETIISSIKKLSASNVDSVVHYSRLSVVELLVSKPNAKLHYSNAIYMNDPMEGKVLFDYFKDPAIENAYKNGERRTETSVYLGSFLPAVDHSGALSHEDNLVMWRTYGKNDEGTEAAGGNVVINRNFFKTEIKGKDGQQNTIVNQTEELLNVIYIDSFSNDITNTTKLQGEIAPLLEDLKEKVLELIKIRDQYQPKEEFYRDIENRIFKQLSKVTYLFKSSDYQYENEVRVIKYVPRNSDIIQYREVNEPHAPKKRFYIESSNIILPHLEKIIVGPKVKNYQQWNLYFDYEIRQLAKKLNLETPSSIDPLGIEIRKSECKFQ